MKLKHLIWLGFILSVFGLIMLYIPSEYYLKGKLYTRNIHNKYTKKLNERTCPESGQNELDQYYRYQLVRYQKGTPECSMVNHHLPNWKEYGVTYDTSKLKVDPVSKGYVVSFIIKEHYNGNGSFGGASFRVETYEYVWDVKHLRLCTVTDLFEGQYDVCCYVEHPCFTVNVTLMYVNYGAYWDVLSQKPYLHKVWEYTSCFAKDNKNIVEPKYCKMPPPMNDIGHWVNMQSKWHWMTSEGCIVRLLDKAAIEKCVEKMPHLHMFGDSHMRNKMIYLSNYLPHKRNWSYSRNTDTIRGKLKYNFVDYWRHMRKDVFKLPSQNKSENNLIILLQNGHWDFRYSPLSAYMDQGIALMMKTIFDKKRKHPWDKIRIIWFTSPPFPQDKTHESRGRSRNNFAIAAANFLTKKEAKLARLEVMDEFNMALPRNMDCADNRNHYTPETIRPENLDQGYVGVNIMNIFLKNVCKI